MEFLGDGSDYIIFKDQSVHVASYASRFLFPSEKIQLKISQLSGGEQARLLIAKLLLRPADVLILDEPTNDLDIDTIEILEETLKQFNGLVVLVSHDRYFLDKLCSTYISLEDHGHWSQYADIHQWLKNLNKEEMPKAEAIAKGQPIKQKVKLSYKEKRQLETIENDIFKIEQELKSAQIKLGDPDILVHHEQLAAQSKLVTKKQTQVNELYQLWETLEKKLNSPKS